jgi:hypothetical protein
LEGLRGKLFALIVLVVTIPLASIVVSQVIASNYYKSSPDPGPWTPFPSATATITARPRPSQTATQTETIVPLLGGIQDCTHTADYWTFHTDVWPAQVIIGNLTYTKDAIIAVYSNQTRDVAANLFIQLNAAFLNFLNAADTTVVETTIVDAANWLNDHPGGSTISASDQQAAKALEITLANYNNGKIGPGLCAGEPTPVVVETTTTPTPTPTPTPTSTLPTGFSRPTKTPTNIPGPGHPKPNNTSVPTSRPTNPPSQSTATPLPALTDTSIPPTAHPTSAPTATSNPLPTPAPTSNPLPTPVPNGPGEL